MEKVRNSYRVAVTSGFVDEGDGVVSFTGGLTITDDTTQRNGTKYDIDSMYIDDYVNDPKLTADHVDRIDHIIGKTVGLKKQGNRVTVDKIVYAVKQNPYAQMAYDLLVNGFSKSFSIETLGTYDSQTNSYLNAELCGLSQVVTPNNYNAHINAFNEVVHNSLEKAQANNLEVEGLEEKFVIAQEEENMAKETKISDAAEEFVNVEVSDTEVAEEAETPVPEAPEIEEIEEVTEGKTEDKEAEEEAPVVETNASPEADEIEEVAPDSGEATEAEESTETKREKAENGTWIETVTTTRTSEYIESEEEKAEREAREARWEEERKSDDADVKITVSVDQDNAAEEKTENSAKDEAPEEVVESEEVVEEKIENKKEIKMTKEDVQALIDGAVKNALDAKVEEPAFKEAPAEKSTVKNQFALAVASTRDLNVEAYNELREINKSNYDALVEAGKVENSVKLEDLGNFVIAPEVLDEVQGKLNSYSAILAATEWRDTNSLKFAWLSRGTTVDMQNVSTGYSGGPVSTGPIDDDDLLKPYGEPTWAPHDDELEELAYVTAVALATIKFAAVDIMADIARQFTHDYDKKRAQLVIARLQQAVDSTGASIAYSGSISDLSTAIADAADSTTVGSLIMSNKTKAVLLRDAIDAENYGLVAELNQGSIFGTNFILVPSDLLPTIGAGDTRTFLVHGQPVVVRDSIFYADMSAFTGRTSGGLSYDVDGRASYEVNGTVRSAFQRNEVVVRGSFFRGGVVTQPELVSAIGVGAES